MGEDLVFCGGPTHPALTLLRQQRYDAHLKDSALIRILNVKQALEARGYPSGLTATLHLDITDDLVPANQGRWTLTIEHGRASAAPGGPGTIATSIRGLAMLYTGYATPQQAALLGEVKGTDADLAAAAHIFTHGTPWMADMF